MAWDHPISPLFTTMFKPERPLIDIPASRPHHDPLRTPEDLPQLQNAPWYATQQLPHIDDVYHIGPFDDEHNRFPDVEDVGWAMGMVSPPSPSRRSSLELEPEHEMVIDDLPSLSPPSPSRRSLASLPGEEDLYWPPFVDGECPQLSPPSPIHCNTSLPPLEFDHQPLFIDTPQAHYLMDEAPSIPLAPPDTRLHTEYRALISLRDRTMRAECTSRARNHALRGRERDLGRAVAALRAEATSATTDPPTPALHAYRAAATRVMLERTEEKRRRKKDKERLKELRVVLGHGVDALLGVRPLCDATPDFGVGQTPAHGLSGGAFGLGLALTAPCSDEDCARTLAERTHAMRRLVARMTMRRRDLGMRSLIEAGNMAGEEKNVGVENKEPRGPSGLSIVVTVEEQGVEEYPGEAEHREEI